MHLNGLKMKFELSSSIHNLCMSWPTARYHVTILSFPLDWRDDITGQPPEAETSIWGTVWKKDWRSAYSFPNDLTVFVFVKEHETGGSRSIDANSFGHIVKKCLPMTVGPCVAFLFASHSFLQLLMSSLSGFLPIFTWLIWSESHYSFVLGFSQSARQTEGLFKRIDYSSRGRISWVSWNSYLEYAAL